MAPRKSYSREYKLEVISFYRENYLYKTHTKFNLDNKTILRWVRQERQLILSKHTSRRVKGSRKESWPQLEAKLVRELEGQRKKGIRIKRWWVINKAKQLKEKMDPSNPLSFSSGWFQCFIKRHNLSYRATTSTAQKAPDDKAKVIQKFHQFIRRNAIRGATKNQRQSTMGKWKIPAIANMDQTPLPFTFGGGKTYSSKGDKTIWVRGGQSGQDKRQCTIQLTIFADGEPRVKPMVIFRGTGSRIVKREKDKWDNRVVVCFQKNLWCDEEMMSFWIEKLWLPAVRGVAEKHLLVADVHRAQKTEGVLKRLKEIGTIPALIPPGCTSLVQPLDVAINKSFKEKCSNLHAAHMQDHLEEYTGNTITAGQRRVLITQWVGQVWEEICATKRNTIVRSFKKCGITVAYNGSEDHLIHIEGLSDYEIGSDVESDVEDANLE